MKLTNGRREVKYSPGGKQIPAIHVTKDLYVSGAYKATKVPTP